MTTPISVAEAVELDGETVRVVAGLVTEDDRTYICDSTDESLPPKCAEPRLELVEAPLDVFDLEDSGGELIGGVDVIIVVDGHRAQYVSSAAIG